LKTITSRYVRAREWLARLSEGQTMTEYALILAAVAVVVFVTYEVLGQDINGLVKKVDTDLAT